MGVNGRSGLEMSSQGAEARCRRDHPQRLKFSRMVAGVEAQKKTKQAAWSQREVLSDKH